MKRKRFMGQVNISTTRRTFGVPSALLALLLLINTHDGRAADTAPRATSSVYSGVSPEAASVFAWLDTLGFPEPMARPYVRVVTGWTRQVNGEEQPVYTQGFLVDDS